ncbi:MAG: TlpA family protein disulfide reductase [Kiritimatiellae bacterium]|nr:TlpA family protein disulfide reductase [Kiritimatiellia bacterium]
MKRFAFLYVCAVVVSGMAAVKFGNLDTAALLHGKAVKSADLKGKVVLVDYWGVNCGPCKAALPRLQQTWESFNHKPFAMIGSHVQNPDDARVKSVLKEAGVTYPVYQDLRAEGTPDFNALPFICVFDAHGRLAYSGHGVPEAIEAVVTAITDSNGFVDLLSDARLDKYKSLKSQLSIGKNVEGAMKKLKADVAAAKKQPGNKVAQEKAAEATAILSSIKKTYERLVEDIALEVEDEDSVSALRDYMILTSTWPTAKAKADEKWGAAMKTFAADPAARKKAKIMFDELKKIK